MSDQTGFDPKRRLCPDGTCTGVMGRDGRCGECGRAAGGGKGGGGGGGADAVSAAPGEAKPDLLRDGDGDGHGNGDGDGNGEGSAEATGPTTTQAASDGTPSSFDPNRRLCDDGECVGVVGPNGACTVCGRVAG